MVNTSKIIDFDIFKSIHCSILKCIFINSKQLQNYEFIFNIEDLFWFVLWALCNMREQWRIHAGRQVGGVSFAGGARVDITCSCQPFQEYCQPMSGNCQPLQYDEWQPHQEETQSWLRVSDTLMCGVCRVTTLRSRWSLSMVLLKGRVSDTHGWCQTIDNLQ